MAEIGCAGILVADTFCGPMKALPREGQLVAVGAMPVKAGGCAANVAISLAKQGFSVDLAGCVGRDQAGDGLLATLKGHGIGCDPVLRSDRFPTSETVILLVEGEDRRYLHSFGANQAYGIESIDRAWLAKLKVFYLGGLFAMPALAVKPLIDLLKFCREKGIVTVIDVVVPAQYGKGGDELRDVLPWVDWFLPNDTESEIFTGCADPLHAAAQLRDWGASNLIVTLGKNGALALSGDRGWLCGAYSPKVVDPSGSGDAFAAGFITGIARGWDMPRTLSHASALGASATRAIGTTDGVFTTVEAERFTKENPLPIEPLALPSLKS